jgi:GntR family transcriptional regulator
MTRELRYLQIVGELRALIADGRIAPGGLLPSEAQLARAHGASRITVRRALAELKADRIVDSRQGFGWFVARAPVPQSLRDLTTIEQQIRASGHEFRREVVSFAVEPPRKRCRSARRRHRPRDPPDRRTDGQPRPLPRRSGWPPTS